MLSNRHLAPGVDTTFLKTHFSVATGAVGALRFTVKSKTFPSTVNLVFSFSSFFYFHFAYNFALCYFLYFWTCVLWIKMTLSIPFTILISWANCTSSFAKYIYQIFLSGTLTGCLYSWALPDILWLTELASWNFWNFDVNAKCGMGFFLLLDLKL